MKTLRFTKPKYLNHDTNFPTSLDIFESLHQTQRRWLPQHAPKPGDFRRRPGKMVASCGQYRWQNGGRMTKDGANMANKW